MIEARAKVRLADEYDEARDEGLARSAGRPKSAPESADIGLRRDEIHEARARPITSIKAKGGEVIY